MLSIRRFLASRDGMPELSRALSWSDRQEGEHGSLARDSSGVVLNAPSIPGGCVPVEAPCRNGSGRHWRAGARCVVDVTPVTHLTILVLSDSSGRGFLRWGGGCRDQIECCCRVEGRRKGFACFQGIFGMDQRIRTTFGNRGPWGGDFQETCSSPEPESRRRDSLAPRER